MPNTPKLSQFIWGIWQFNLICTDQLIHTTGSQDPWHNDTWMFLFLKTWQQMSQFVWGTSWFDFDSQGVDNNHVTLRPMRKLSHACSLFLKHDNKLSQFSGTSWFDSISHDCSNHLNRSWLGVCSNRGKKLMMIRLQSSHRKSPCSQQLQGLAVLCYLDWKKMFTYPFRRQYAWLQ